MNKNLVEHNKELSKLCEKIFAKHIKSENDKDTFLAFVLAKAYKSHKSIMLLCDNQSGQDAAIIVRSLFDLMVNLLYIFQTDSNERFNRYGAFDWVLRKRMIDYAKSNKNMIEMIEQRAVKKQFGDDQLEEINKQAKEAQIKYKFKTGWSDKTIEQMAREVGKNDHYQTVYRLQSNVSHSNSRSMLEYVKIQEDKSLLFDIGGSDVWAEESLVAASDFFLSIIAKINSMLKLGIDEELDSITKRFLEAMSEINHKTKS